MVAITAYLLLMPAQPDAVWLKWISITLWIVLIVIIARNSDLFERPKEVKPEDIIAPELLVFLKEKGVFEDFMSNYNDNRNAEWRKYWAYLDGITCAFDWEDTPQGWDYWCNLDHEYEEQQSKKR